MNPLPVPLSRPVPTMIPADISPEMPLRIPADVGLGSVEQFLGAVNWDGRVLVCTDPCIEPAILPVNSGGPISLTIPVGVFLSTVNWDGGEAGQSGQPEPVPARPEDLTLEKISDLF